jgi:tetratricopeptide (TPR) repeat protein
MRTFVATLALASFAAIGCSRNNIEAVNLYNEGVQAKKAQNIEEAISKFEQASKLDPQNNRVLSSLMEAYRKKEDWPRVVSTAIQAEKVAPTFANYYFEHGHAIVKQAQKPGSPTMWADAKEPLQQAIAKDSNLADAYEDLAEVLLHIDEEQGALQNYTKAIDVKPDEPAFYVPLADLYLRLGFPEQAEQVVREGLSFSKDEVNKALFNLHSLMGSIKEGKNDMAGAVAEYEAAKKACGACNEAGQQIAYFNLGTAYASLTPPRKNEAMAQLQSFQKIVCKGAAATRYADQCQQAQQFATKLGGLLQ